MALVMRITIVQSVSGYHHDRYSITRWVLFRLVFQSTAPTMQRVLYPNSQAAGLSKAANEIQVLLPFGLPGQQQVDTRVHFIRLKHFQRTGNTPVGAYFRIHLDPSKEKRKRSIEELSRNRTKKTQWPQLSLRCIKSCKLIRPLIRYLHRTTFLGNLFFPSLLLLS